jgi:hypothetical protein
MTEEGESAAAANTSFRALVDEVARAFHRQVQPTQRRVPVAIALRLAPPPPFPLFDHDSLQRNVLAAAWDPPDRASRLCVWWHFRSGGLKAA